MPGEGPDSKDGRTVHSVEEELPHVLRETRGPAHTDYFLGDWSKVSYHPPRCSNRRAHGRRDLPEELGDLDLGGFRHSSDSPDRYLVNAHPKLARRLAATRIKTACSSSTALVRRRHRR